MNKMVKIGALCLIVALGLAFVGCEDFTKVEQGGVSKPGGVAFSINTAKDTLTVTWDAVSGADSYDVVVSQSGKKSWVSLGNGYGGMGYPFTSTTGGVTTIPDFDKWAYSFGADDLHVNGTFTIGVIAISARNDKNPSAPAWASGTFTVDQATELFN